MVPECLTFLRSARVCIMKFVGRPKWDSFLVVFGLESLHVLGLALLFFVALPNVDSIRALMMTNAMALFPSILLMFNINSTFGKGWSKMFFIAFSIVACGIQVGGLVIWTLAEKNIDNLWTVPVGLILISFGWWESFVHDGASRLGVVNQYLYTIRRDMFEKNQRYFIYIFLSIWKICLFLSLFMIFTATFNLVESTAYLFDNFKASFKTSVYLVYENGTFTESDEVDDTYENNIPSNTLLAQLFCAWATYVFAKFACKTTIQRVAFALPLNLVMPVAVSGLIGMCAMREKDPCQYKKSIPNYVFFECPAEVGGFDVIADFGWYWLLLLLSQFWIAFFTWYPKSQRLASTEQLFHTPYYSGLLLDQDLLFNRRSDSGRLKFRLDVKNPNKDGLGEVVPEEVKESSARKKRFARGSQDLPPNEDEVSRVYGCATMWHESTEEISEMLKSIFRIDEDYSAR